MKKDNNIIKFHKQIQINIGLVIFGIIVLYVIFHIFSYLTSDSITVYEVTEGTIAKDTSYRALAIRQEEVMNAPTSGDIFYYAANFDQVGVRTNIYSIDTTGTITAKLKGSNQNLDVLTKSDMTKLTSSIRDFIYDYDGNKFQKVYAYKTDLDSDLQQYYSVNMLQEMEGEITQAQQQGKFTYYKAHVPGTIVYQTDGMEGISLSDVTKDSFNAKNVKVTNLKHQDKVKEGQAVYKVITSDRWNLMFPIDKDNAKKFLMEETAYVQIRFLEDNATTWAACEIEKRDGDYYMILSLDDGVARYANSRFVHIALMLDEQSGLKIPNSAIVEKTFFTVPKKYFFKGNDSEASGLMIKGENGKTELVVPTVYYESDDMYYIDSDKVTSDTKILQPDSSVVYRIGTKTDKLKGVYNVNKGYAVFKQIKVLYQNEDYAIIEKGTPYGIASFDHIALQGDQIKENEMINER